MTENQYRELFKALGIDAGDLGKVLRYRGRTRRVYFNFNWYVGIYFSARRDDKAWYPSNLWEEMGPYGIQEMHRPWRVNVVPRSGMETEAFRNLVSNWRNSTEDNKPHFPLMRALTIYRKNIRLNQSHPV